uniref:NAD(P)(+)--arginine ADP-ribosyltransferase n=1 Tax=Hippocampus comes TaxID=109280 RepID=A0A3Q3DMR3_HIPCM
FKYVNIFVFAIIALFNVDFEQVSEMNTNSNKRGSSCSDTSVGRDACDSGERGCNTKPIVLTDVVVLETMESHTNFSQAWSNAEEKARRPAHAYIEKQPAVAIYMYTKSMLKHSNNKVRTVNVSGQQSSKDETIHMDSKLYSSLREAIQVLKHSQPTCLKTIYRTQMHLQVDISNKQVRFGSFTLASGKRSLERSCTCFKVNTCFGADISHYSALETNHQVFIPPYEVFKVSRVHIDVTEDCKVTYKLESNLNCVYDVKRNMLHLISVLFRNTRQPLVHTWKRLLVFVFVRSCVIT